MAHWVPVTSGIANGEITTIIGQVSSGDVIVKSLSEEIRDGQNTRIKRPKQAHNPLFINKNYNLFF